MLHKLLAFPLSRLIFPRMSLTLPQRLAAAEPDELLTKLLSSLRRDLRRSRNDMAKNYRQWDKNIDTYRSVIVDDPDDRRAKQKREPSKQTIPLSYAQVNTFVTYVVLLYTQNPKIFEMTATGTEDFDLRDVSESIVDREVRNNQYMAVLTQFLLDIARMNLGVMKTSWTDETMEVEDETAQQFDELGEPIETEATTSEVTVYEGSKVYNISPFNWFPDTRLPMIRWREGQFCADETAFHIAEVKDWDDVYGTEHIMPMDRETWKNRGTTRLAEVDPTVKRKESEDDFMVCITEVQAWIVPAKYELSKSKNREMWKFCLANDNRLISAEHLEDANMGFSYDAATMAPDQHSELSDSLSSLIDSLQETVTWLINSRIAAVRKNIESQLVVSQQHIELSDLESRAPFIRLKKSAPAALGVDKFIQQLRTADPTTSHFSDTETLMRIMEMVSGVNGNAMGQFATGRRSATEARNVQGGAAGRMKLIASTIFATALAPQGKRFLLNARQWMSYETFEKIIGFADADLTYDEFHADRWYSLVGSEDFFVFDATSASEKNFMAQSLQEFAIALMSNPEVLATSGLNVLDMLKEIQALRGSKNLDRFKTAIPNVQSPPIIPGGLPAIPAGPGPNPVQPQIAG